MNRVYLDWNATTPPLPEVLDAMRAAHEAAWANPSSIHAHGRTARARVEDARAAIGALAGADARDVVLTSGGTEANNLALRSAFSDGDRSRPGVLVTSRLEHPSVTRVAEALEREGRARVRWLAVGEGGSIELDDLDRALAEEPPRLVCVMAVNHETGVVQPIADVIARARAAGARVHVDAIQAWGKLDVPRGADTIAIAAHKLRGPKGIGALVARPGLAIAPVLLGGAQERGIRPGTVDPALAAGFGVAAARACGRVYSAIVASRRDRLESALVRLGAERVGDVSRRAPHVSSTIWPSWGGAELVAALDLEGVSVSSGAACSAGTVERSPVLTAMLGEARARSGLRVSIGESTTDADIDVAIAAFERVIART